MTLRLSFFFTLLLLSFHSEAELRAPASILEEAAGIKERITNFVGPEFYRPLTELDQIVPSKGTAKDQPWSGSYWPLYQGGPARPYAERGFTRRRFRANYNQYQARLSSLIQIAINGRLDPIQLDNLSPTEKYDLYLGDTNFTLSKSVWESLYESENSRRTRIEWWEGMCHGWSPAAAYAKRPTHPIEVTSLDGRYKINFYPDDLKALSTLLWANSLIQDDALVEGIRCKTNFPNRDRVSGKVTTLRCKGVNPGVFHLSVLGLVGQKQVSFVINKNNDEEIWNQPVQGYQFNYFNIRTLREGDLKSSVIDLKTFDDPFAVFRSPKARYLVGVDMTLSYISETEPSHQAKEGPENDLIEKFHMRYDLELDQDYNVLGGEWVDEEGSYGSNSRYIPNYPAFMWRFRSDNPFAASIVDAKLSAMGPAGLQSSVLVPLSGEASSFRYTRYLIDEDGELDRLLFDENGNPKIGNHELRPQPIATILNTLLDMAHE